MTLGRIFGIFILAATCLGMSATTALAQLTLTKVKPTADGYELGGKGFGRDKAKVQIFEGMTQVSPMAIVSVADDLVVVRSKPSGTVQHRVVVGSQSSTMSFTHTGIQDAVKAKPAAGVTPGMAASAKSMAPTPARVASLTQTLTTPPASMTGNRGQAAPPPARVASLTQTVTTPAASMTGNRSQAAPPPARVASLTQTLTTPQASMTGNR